MTEFSTSSKRFTITYTNKLINHNKLQNNSDIPSLAFEFKTNYKHYVIII